MKTVKDLETGKGKRFVKLLTIGNTGAGKTHLAATFPKCYFMITEPGGEETWLNRPELKKNIVGFDYFIPRSAEDTKQVFIDLNKACDEAYRMAESGEIETLILDNMTYLAENRWSYINKHTPQYGRSGELNGQAMYGDLGRWLYQFTYMKLLRCPCNVVVNCHEMLESDEAMDKKPDKSTPILPSILGGFRNNIGGMFSCVFYLAHAKGGDGKYKYFARTKKGQGKNAKNRYNLPETIENISYDTIVAAIDKSVKDNNKGDTK